MAAHSKRRRMDLAEDVAHRADDLAHRPARTEPLVTIVSYCSRERAFGEALVNAARSFSDLVVVSIGTRLYTGEPEDVDGELEHLGLREEGDRDGAPGRCPVLGAVYHVFDAMLATPVALHNRAREAGAAIAAQWAGPGAGWWALLLDGDEVPEAGGALFAAWWRGEPGARARRERFTVTKLANRWAFLHPCLVATETEDSVMLAHSDVLLHPHVGALRHMRERDGVYLAHAESAMGLPVRLRRGECLEGAPMFTHFSWVRGDEAWVRRGALRALDPASGSPLDAWRPPVSSDTDRDALRSVREGLKAKVRNWGHRQDRDWPGTIDAALDAVESSDAWPQQDFVHRHRLVWVGGPREGASTASASASAK